MHLTTGLYQDLASLRASLTPEPVSRSVLGTIELWDLSSFIRGGLWDLSNLICEVVIMLCTTSGPFASKLPISTAVSFILTLFSGPFNVFGWVRFTSTSLRSQPQGFGSPGDIFKGFSGGGIGYSIKCFTSRFSLLIIGSLAIKTWYVYGAQTLTCLLMSI